MEQYGLTLLLQRLRPSPQATAESTQAGPGPRSHFDRDTDHRRLGHERRPQVASQNVPRSTRER
jgi:hypothetical protein